MAKKKLLNETVVRRFMGLAGMQSNLVSNKLTEMYGKGMDEDLYEEEEEEDEEDMEGESDLDMDQEEAQEIADAIRTLQPLADKIEAQLGGEAGEEEDMDLGADDEKEDLGGEDDMDLEDDEEDMDLGGDDEEPPALDEEMFEGVELQLSEDEIVQEVAKRVAKRILRAKRAKAQLDEALGRSRKRR